MSDLFLGFMILMSCDKAQVDAAAYLCDCVHLNVQQVS